ncbi:MAG: efflux RND transporter permease subunit, partial [Acidobacteriota bacterium]
LELRLVRDRSREVVDSLSQLAQAALIGLVLGTLVLRTLLGSWRPTLALVVVVPVSIIAAFGAFYLFDVSLDLVSLAGLALAAGMLVDNSIVVLEAIASARDADAPGSTDPVVDGSRQIAGALVASFLTTAVVFLPLVYLRGLAQAFFGVQAFAIVSTLLISLVVSLSLTPVLARRFGDGRRGDDERAPRGMSPGRGAYLRLLDAALARPWPWLVLTAIALATSFGAFAGLDRELVPAGSSRALAADLRLPAGTVVDEATRRLDRLADGLQTAAEMTEGTSTLLIYAGDGRSVRPTVDTSDRPHTGDVEILFPDAAALDAAIEPVSRAVSSVPGLEAHLDVRRGAVASAVASAGRLPRIEVSAATEERLGPLIMSVLDHLDGVGLRGLPLRRGARLASGIAGDGLAVALDWDPVRLAALDVRPASIVRQVRDGLGGFTLGRATVDSTEPEILLDATRPGSLDQLPVRVDERILPLGALGQLSETRRSAPLERRNGRPIALLDVEGGSADEVEQHLASLELGFGDRVRLAGETLELRRSFAQLRLALGLALVLVFLTVAALYESLRLPLVVLVTVPVAAAGAVGALAVTGQSLNVMSLLGFILLAGIVVNNALVLLHRVEQHRRTLPVIEALRAAAGERYRPILMTTLTTLLGMLPLALLGGEGVELRRALATTVTGGLTTSWAASLLVVPLVYRALVGDRSR